MTDNQNLQKIFVKFTTGKRADFIKFLNKMPESSLANMLVDLLTMYVNDSNSSAVREQVTTAIAGYTHLPEKLGYNGFKTDVKGKTVDCEVKPKNINTHKQKITRLNGSGSFNDYTWKRFRKDKKANLNILISGFVDGRLVYIIEFPFTSTGVLDKLRTQLNKKLPNGDVPNEYVRGAGISYLNYIDGGDVKLVYCAPNFESFEAHIVKRFFAWLKQEAKKSQEAEKSKAK